MGKQNVEVRQWLEKKERYADLFNAVCCNGEQVFCAENLEKMDIEQDTVLEDSEENEIIVQRFRDLKMKMYQDIYQFSRCKRFGEKESVENGFTVYFWHVRI